MNYEAILSYIFDRVKSFLLFINKKGWFPTLVAVRTALQIKFA